MPAEKSNPGIIQLGELFSRSLTARGQGLVKESIVRFDDGTDINNATIDSSQALFGQGVEQMRQAQRAREMFHEFDQALADAGLAVPFQQFLTEYFGRIPESADKAPAFSSADLQPNEVPAHESVSSSESSAKEKRKRVHWGDRRRTIVLALLELNETRTDFKYPSLREVTPVAYADKLAAFPNRTEGKTRVANYRFQAGVAVESFVADIVDSKARRTKNSNALLAEIRSIPEYSTIPEEVIVKILRRQISYSELTLAPKSSERTTFSQAQPSVAQANRDSRILSSTGQSRTAETRQGVNRDLYEIRDIDKLPESEKVLYVYFEVADNRKDWKSPSLEDAVQRIYGKDLAIRTRTQRERMLNGYLIRVSRLHSKLFDMIKDSAGEPIENMPAEIRHFMAWLKEQPLFRTLTPSETLSVLRRKLDVRTLIARLSL